MNRQSEIHAEWPKQRGNIETIHTIGNINIIEYWAIYKGKLDTRQTYFCVASKGSGAPLVTCHDNLNSALVHGIAHDQGCEDSAEYHARLILRLAKTY